MKEEIKIAIKVEDGWDLWKKLTKALIQQNKSSIHYMQIFMSEYEKEE